MTITLATDCSSFDISSDSLSATNTEVVLTIKHNGVTTYTPDVDANQTSPITVDASLLGQSTLNLEDGVYYVKLTITAQDSSIVEESLCVAVLCGYKCSIIDWYKDIPTNIDKILSYEALKVANSCVKCDCSVMLTLYNNIINTTTNDCGCQ